VVDNVIEDMQENGVAAADDTVSVAGLRIAGNRLDRCRGGRPAAWPWRAGAVVLAGGTDVTIASNRFTGNGPLEPGGPAFRVIFLEDLSGAEIGGNVFQENTVSGATTGLGVVQVTAPRGALRICGNVLQRNGGQALWIDEGSGEGADHVTVHDNQFLGGFNLSKAPWIDVEAARLSWQGNVSAIEESSGTPSVQLRTTHAVVSGNTARGLGEQQAMRVESQDAALGRLVASGNLTWGTMQIVGFPAGGVATPGNLVLP